MIPLEYFGYAFWISMACLVWYALVDAVRARPSRLEVLFHDERDALHVLIRRREAA